MGCVICVHRLESTKFGR